MDLEFCERILTKLNDLQQKASNISREAQADAGKGETIENIRMAFDNFVAELKQESEGQGKVTSTGFTDIDKWKETLQDDTQEVIVEKLMQFNQEAQALEKLSTAKDALVYGQAGVFEDEGQIPFQVARASQQQAEEGAQEADTLLSELQALMDQIKLQIQSEEGDAKVGTPSLPPFLLLNYLKVCLIVHKDFWEVLKYN